MSLIRDEMKAWVDSTEWEDTWTEDVLIGTTPAKAKVTNALDGVDFQSGGYEIKAARKFRFCRSKTAAIGDNASITYAGDRYRVIQVSPANGSPIMQAIGVII
jgi:hypothetical protein